MTVDTLLDAAGVSAEGWLQRKQIDRLDLLSASPWARVYRATTTTGDSFIVKVVTRPGNPTDRLPALLSQRAPGLCPKVIAALPQRGMYLYEDLERDRMDPRQEPTSIAILSAYGALQAQFAMDPALAEALPRHSADKTLDDALRLAKADAPDAPGNIFALMPPDRRHSIGRMLGRFEPALRQMAALIDQTPATLNHTDLNSGNLHIRASGHLCLMDWDDAILSAPGWSLPMLFSGLPGLREALSQIDDASQRGPAVAALRSYIRLLTGSGHYTREVLNACLPASACFGVLKYITDMAPYRLPSAQTEQAVLSYALRRLDGLERYLEATVPAALAAPAGGVTPFPEVWIDDPQGDPDALRRAAGLFRANGALMIRNCVPASRIATIHDEFEAGWPAHEQAIAAGSALRVGDRRYMVTLGTEGALGRAEVLAPPVLMALLDDVLGPKFILGSLTTVVSLPGSDPQHWHCDNDSLFPETGSLLTPAFSIAVILPLIALTSEIGATEVKPGSHLRPDRDAPPLPSAVPAPNPGDCYLMDSRLMHRGLANQSSVKRPILSLVYHRDYQNFNQQKALTISETTVKALPEDRQALVRWAV
jgi:ectoine hydroxylase-related dioxygenase (phytanoyl-CoA dioxygenase family)